MPNCIAQELSGGATKGLAPAGERGMRATPTGPWWYANSGVPGGDIDKDEKPLKGRHRRSCCACNEACRASCCINNCRHGACELHGVWAPGRQVCACCWYALDPDGGRGALRPPTPPAGQEPQSGGAGRGPGTGRPRTAGSARTRRTDTAHGARIEELWR